MIRINMKSRADMVEGQGVLSAHDEQVGLVRDTLSERYFVTENARGKYDITHYHTINPGFFLSLPMAKMRGATVGYVHFLPETLENSIKLPLVAKKAFYWYVIQFYKSMDYLVTVNPYFIDRLASYGIDRDKITYIPNFVSSEQFYKIDDRASLRKQYGLDPEQFVVLCVGQLQRRKGVLDFIEVAKKTPDVQYLWAGASVFGKISDGYDEINEAVNNAPPNVKFLGLVDRSKMNEIYNLANVMFLPSYEELFPMTILESMNCGVPLLLRDIDIYENILFDYYLRADGNDGFIAEINRLREDEAYFAAASEKSMEGHLFYSREHVSELWDNFYQLAACKAHAAVPAYRAQNSSGQGTKA